jgi:hypothetical protein
MRPFLKVGVVAVGYIAAFLIASAAVGIRLATTSGPDAQASGGMYAFGDAILFVAVFGGATLVPAGAALFFLRPYRQFWTVLSAFGLGVAVTGLTAAALFAIGRHAAPSPLATWAGFSVLRFLVAPLLALMFLVCTVLSPYRFPRLAFLAATVMEAARTEASSGLSLCCSTGHRCSTCMERLGALADHSPQSIGEKGK